MKTVMTFGCWDLLHVGHLCFLRNAASLGDLLAVGVAGDGAIIADKGTPPVISLASRVELLEALRCVWRACPYIHLEFLTSLRCYNPQVLAVGEDWGHAQRHIDAEQWCRDNGCEVVRLKRYPGESTTAIKQRILNQNVLT